MKYLKLFRKDSYYQQFINGEGNKIFLPNVSYCKENNYAYFNPKGKLEIYYKFDETNVPSYPYQMLIDTTHFKSFKVDGVEYIPQSEGGGSSTTTMEISDVITYNGDPNVFTPYLDNALGNGVYSSIKVTVPNFNPESEEIFLVMYTYMDGQTMCEMVPTISLGMLTSVGNGEYEMIPEMVNSINMIFDEYISYGLDIKIFFLGVENGYEMDEGYITSFVSKPTIVNYEGEMGKVIIYEVSEPCEITAEVEWANNVNETDFFIECFGGNYNLIGFNNVLFSDITFDGNLSNMFNECTGLTSLDLSNWDVSNVTDMNSMFSGCSELTSLDSISNWDTSKVTDMGNMFRGCSGLTSLDLSNWDVNNVTDMSYMFSDCYSLTSLDSISNWDTSKVTDMSYMFWDCSGLTSLHSISNWDTSKVTNMYRMFYDCKSLTSLDLSNWDVSNITDMSWMFEKCYSLTEIRMGGNPSNLTDANSIYGMFSGIASNGSFYYNSVYDYSLILSKLPSTWTAVPCTLIDGVLVPNE